MPLSQGSRIGAYEITGPLGAGGMGEVYRARDTKLDRDVAIKILPPEFATDAERVARFRREAKTLASINHPHIAHVHGLEETSDGALALVMELVEGEDLAERLKRGAIPLDEALPIAKQIAEALEAAHEQGIVHRDLKPANIKLRDDGTAKVLDFGLAKPQDLKTSGPQDLSNSPTITTPAMTMRGVILGTAAYMAPEQAKGRPVDRRADIWAFGCVLYEMLTGARPFDGEDTTEILGAIVKTEPDWTRLPAGTPPRISALVRRCLQKDPKKRLQHIGDARVEIDDVLSSPVEPVARPRVAWLPWAVAAVMTIVAAVALVTTSRTGPATATSDRVVQFDIPMSRFRNPAALSPDGRYLAYSGLTTSGQQSVWLRDLAKATAERLGDVPAASALFWTPNGQSLYVLEPPSTLRRFDIRTRSSVTQPMSQAPVGLGQGGLTLVDDRRIIVGAADFSPVATLQVWTPDSLTSFLPLATAENEVRQADPARLGADRVTFTSFRADGSTRLCVTALVNPQPRCIGGLSQTGRASYHDGRLLFPRGTSLLARGFDPDRVAFTGEEQLVVDGMRPVTVNFWPRIDVASTGVLAFPSGDGGEDLVWQTNGGDQRAASIGGATTNFSLSPDGTRVLTTQGATNSSRLLNLIDLKSGGSARLGTTYGDGIWAPDGRRFAHRTSAGIVLRTVEDPRESVLVAGVAVAYPEDWSRDGRWIVVGMRDGPTQIELVPVNGGERVTVLGRDAGIAGADEMHFSPDGKWLAFNALSGARHEVFVVPLPPSGQRWQVSTAGGMQARWHPSGRTLYYLDPTGKMMAVDIAQGATFAAGVPKPLFDVGFTPNANFDDYRVAPDGRFLVKKPDAASAVRVIINWPALLVPQNTP